MPEEVSGCARLGWKIAATNVTGQKHIGVEGPIGGRLLDTKVVSGDGPVPMADNLMRVAEAEFAFVLGRNIPARGQEYTPDEVALPSRARARSPVPGKRTGSRPTRRSSP
jgi:2-keto-4-pentenoate hydratase